jgi:hypothetical protein
MYRGSNILKSSHQPYCWQQQVLVLASTMPMYNQMSCLHSRQQKN